MAVGNGKIYIIVGFAMVFIKEKDRRQHCYCGSIWQNTL